MLFITNDLNTKLVDDEEYEDNLEEKYKGYVIARKLYVKIDLSLNEPFSDDIRKIESVEVLRSGEDGYVTFDRNLKKS